MRNWGPRQSIEACDLRTLRLRELFIGIGGRGGEDGGSGASALEGMGQRGWYSGSTVAT